MYGVVLIAVLAVMGGVIAYIGDKLGSKVGKRKLTIFGLRPKHTSILVTIVTGIIIAATTLAVMASVSKDVRTALFGMGELKAQLVSLTREVNDKTKELDVSRTELEAKTKEYSALTAKINETIASLAKVTDDLAAVTAERDRTAMALARVQEDYNAAANDLKKSRAEIAALQAVKNELDAKVASLNNEKTLLQSDVDRLNQLTANLRKGIITVREGVVVYRAGEVLSVSVIKAGKSAEENGQALAAIIQATNQGILNRLGVTDKNMEALWIAQTDFDKTVAFLGTTNDDVVVRIMSQGNIIYGEPVIARIELFPNRLVYAGGSPVYSTIYDNARTTQQARAVVGDFLQKVNVEAVNRGILPDPLTGEVGSIDIAQLTDIINKVKNSTGRVELKATTKTEIYTVGPLVVDISVHNIP